jgi:hypothetical protein
MRALQSSVPADPDLDMMRAEHGDRYLLCSDGLSDVVSDETMHKTLQDITDLDQAVEQLIDLAIRSGGPDNITCVLADVVDSETGPTAPSQQAVIVGALATGDVRPPQRIDSPATRAHLLTHGQSQIADADDDALGGREADGGPDGIPAAGPAMRQAVWVRADSVRYGADAGGPVGYGADASSYGADVSDADEDADAEGEDDDEDDGRPGHRSRRRWPVVTFILVVLVGVVGAGGYYGWSVTQNQYFVGTADGHVAVFRGVNEPVAGISMFSVVQRTSIPVAAMPSGEAAQIRTTITAGNLAAAMRIVLRIRHGYQCGLTLDAIRRWAAAKPKPVVSASHRKRTKRTARSGSPALVKAAGGQHPYPPRPVLPPFCPAFGGV